MESINQQSRIKYDEDQIRLHDVTAERPLKWYTTDSQQNRYLEYGNAFDVDVSQQLSRSAPTRLNPIDRPNTLLYGTAPFLGLHDGDKGTESSLWLGVSDNICKPIVHEHDHTNYYLHDQIPTLYAGLPLLVEQDRVGQSTRNENIRYGN